MKFKATSAWTSAQPMRSQHKRGAAGFTLVELIFVIAMMGILAAVAVPRYIDMGKEARISKIKAIGGSVATAAKIAHGAALTQGAAASVQINGVVINLVNAYPAASAAGISRAANIDAVADGLIVSYSGSDAQFAIDGTSVSGAALACYVLYTEASAGAMPQISTITSNC